MSKPTTAIFPIENGKLLTTLDCNGLQLLNLDTSNLDISGPDGGNDTGTTTAILKGDGNHGFADAIADTDYTTPASLSTKEDSTSHDADIIAVQSDITTLQTSVALKADSVTVTAALALKADASAFTAYVASNDAAVALKANSSDVTSALALKADASALTSGLATKEPTLPTTANDSWILARHNAGSGSSWFFVDPVTLGTTNQSFVDGQSFTNTNFDSASAQFNSGDIGKTITGTNIPASTTISSITSATRVVLSQATTGTGGPGLSFTIFNRLTVAGGGGTVTSVSVNNDAANALFATGVSNPTTSATIGITMSTAVAANAIWGNPNAFPAAATFMTPAQQRTSLGATTAGSGLITVPNPNPAAGNVATWIRFLADNSVQTRTAAQTITDLGAEVALTFSAPITRTVSGPTNTIAIPAATDSVAGHLTATDHATFNAKVGPTRTITTTSPLAGGGALSADLTLSMPAATTGISGYLTASDFLTFTAKPPNSRTISTTAPLTGGGDLSANRTIAMPKATSVVDGYLAAADFVNFLAGSPRTTLITQTSGNLTLVAGSPPVNRFMIGAQLTGALTIVLPAANLYGASIGYPYIEFVDIVGSIAGTATANFGITLVPSGTDLIDNAGSIALPRGAGYIRLNSNGGGPGRWTTTKYYVDSFKNGNDPTQTVTLDVSHQTSGVPGVLTLANGPSVTVQPTKGTNIQPTSGVIFDIDEFGVPTKARLTPADLLPVEYPVGTAGVSLAPGPVPPVTNNGTVDTVRIAGTLTGAISLQWPDANKYSTGESVTLFDASGSVSTTNPVTVSNLAGHTFNGVNSFTFDEPNGRKVLISDGALAWTVSLVKTSIRPFTPIAAVNNTFTIPLDPNAVKQNFHLNLGNGQNILVPTNPTDGMEIDLILMQPSSGAAGTLSLPSVSYVSGNGIGVISLTATNGAIDRLCGIFDGFLNAYIWQTPILLHTSAVVPNAPSALATSGITASKVVLTWTDNSANETGFRIERAAGLGATTGFSEIGTVAANVVTYTDFTVASAHPYTYRVRAYNAAGNSAYSATAGATTSAGGATADVWEVHFNENAGLTAAATVGPNATLNYADWTTSTQSGSGAAFNVVPGLVTTAAPTVTPTGGVAATTNWSYRVAAFKGTLHNGNVAGTTAVGYATLNGTTFNRITWTAVTGADSYSIYRTLAGGTPSSIGIIASGIPQATVTFDDTGIIAPANSIPANISVSTDVHSAVTATPVVYGTTQKISVAFWIKSTFSSTAGNTIVTANQGAANWRINYIAGSKLQIVFPGGTGSATFTVPNTTINDNAWHHVAITMDNSTTLATTADVKVYYDGSATPQTTTMGTNTKSGGLQFPSSAPAIATDSTSTFVIDDVRIYGSIISTATINGLFVGGAI